MSEPFLGEIKIMPVGLVPKGWAYCNGQLLQISQNQALFSLLGTRYGGDGRVTFGLPDLPGRTPVHAGPQVGSPGARGGAESVTLNINQIPQHQHVLQASSALATSGAPSGAMVGKKGRFGRDVFAAPANLTSLNPAAVATAGGSQPHNNMQPFLALNFVIALQGIFPSSN